MPSHCWIPVALVGHPPYLLNTRLTITWTAASWETWLAPGNAQCQRSSIPQFSEILRFRQSGWQSCSDRSAHTGIKGLVFWTYAYLRVCLQVPATIFRCCAFWLTRCAISLLDTRRPCWTPAVLVEHPSDPHLDCCLLGDLACTQQRSIPKIQQSSIL